MKKELLERYTSDLELENDQMAYLLVQVKRLIELQPLCDFDVWWMHDVSPILMNEKTIDFLNRYKGRFKRRVTAKEFILYDMIIKHNDPETFEQFQNMVLTNTFERDLKNRKRCKKVS